MSVHLQHRHNLKLLIAKFSNTTPLPLTIFGGSKTKTGNNILGGLKTETGNSESGNNILGGVLKTETGNFVGGKALKLKLAIFCYIFKTPSQVIDVGPFMVDPNP